MSNTIITKINQHTHSYNQLGENVNIGKTNNKSIYEFEGRTITIYRHPVEGDTDFVDVFLDTAYKKLNEVKIYDECEETTN